MSKTVPEQTEKEVVVVAERKGAAPGDEGKQEGEVDGEQVEKPGDTEAEVGHKVAEKDDESIVVGAAKIERFEGPSKKKQPVSAPEDPQEDAGRQMAGWTAVPSANVSVEQACP